MRLPLRDLPQKTDKANPKWYMVDVTFVSRAKHLVPLSLLRTIASSTDVPEEVSYIGEEGAKAIKGNLVHTHQTEHTVLT